MGTGYTRNDTSNNIADGNIINAADLDGEFDAIESAFGTSGHTHDGTSAEGGPITVLGPVQDFVASATEIKPKTTNTLDIGTSGLLFKDMYLDGVATLGSIKIDNAGTIGSASDSDAIAISSGGVVTFSQAPFVDVTNATTNAVTDVLGIQVQSSGTPAVGIGSGLTLGVETASGNVETAGAIRIVSTGLTPTDEEIDLVFYSMRNGSLTEGFRYDSSADSLDVTGILTVSGSSTSTFNSGAENVVATFTSTDTEAQINLVDSTGSAQIRSRNDLRFYTNGGSTRAMDIDSSGKVGINEDSPQTKLHIKNSSVGESWSAYSGTVATLEENSSNGGVLQFVTNSSYTGEIWFGDADARNQGRIRYEHANDKLELWANAAERIGIESTGKVIIQTPTSGTALEVNVIDNAADGFMVKQGSNEYISVDTTNSSEKIILGNTNTNPNIGIGNNSPSAILDVKSTGAVMTTLRGTSSSIAYLDLTNYATSGNGVGTGIEFRANSTTQERQVGFITAEWTDNTDATRDSRMDFDININGGTTAALKLGTDEIVVNEGGHVTNFRVESDSEPNMLFVDSTDNRIGIRTNDPASTFHIDSDNASGTTYGIVQNDGAANTNTIAGWVIRDGTTVMSGIRRRRDGSGSPVEIGNFSNDETVDLVQNNQRRITFDTSSNIVVNEPGNVADFRVESDSNSDMLRVNGTLNRVGVGINPSHVFHAEGSTSGDWISLIKNTHSSNGYGLKVQAGDDANVQPFRVANLANDDLFHIRGNGKIQVNTAQNTNADFQILGSSMTNLFYADASANLVGLNTDAPDSLLHVNGQARFNSARVLDNGSSSPLLAIKSDDQGPWSLQIQNDTYNTSETYGFRGYVDNSNNAVFQTNSNASYQMIELQQRNNTTTRSLLKLGTSSVSVFNDSGADIDFRIESENNANALFVDAGRDRIYIGKNTSDNLSTNSVTIGGSLNTSWGASLGFENDATGGANGFIIATDDSWGIGSGFGMGFGAAGSDNFRLFMKSGETVFNERSQDIDFRVETPSNTHALFIDSGNNRTTIAGNFAVDESAAGIEAYRSNQFFTGEGSAGSSGSWTAVFNSGYTAALDVHVIAYGGTPSQVGVWCGKIAVAYGGGVVGLVAERYQGGNITDIDVRYNNTGQNIEVNVTYTGTTPDLYWNINGPSHKVMSNVL